MGTGTGTGLQFRKKSILIPKSQRAISAEKEEMSRIGRNRVMLPKFEALKMSEIEQLHVEAIMQKGRYYLLEINTAALTNDCKKSDVRAIPMEWRK